MNKGIVLGKWNKSLYHVRLCCVNFKCLWYKLWSLVQCL